MRTNRRTALLALAGTLAAPGLARAAFSDRPIRLVLGYGGGGQTDIVSRHMAEALGRKLGQQVLADNRPGAAANLAAEIVARAPPDGHTLLVAGPGTNSGINSLLYRTLPYDWRGDFAPVGLFCTTACVLLVHNSIPGADVPALIEWIRRNPGRFTFASAGIGATTHLAMELLGQRANLDMVHVPYRQSTQAMTDLLAGRVHSRCLGVPEGDTVRNAPSLRALAVTGAARNPAWPEVPAMKEHVPGFEAVSYFGLVAPARTPPDIIGQINAALNEALGDERLLAAYARSGADIAPRNTPEEFGTYIRSEAEKWMPLVRSLNLTPE